MRLLPLLLLGCGPVSLEGKDSGDTGGGDADTDTDADTDADADNAPVVTSIDSVDCAADVDGADRWVVAARADDPQGTDTLDQMGCYAEIILDGQSGGQHPGVASEGVIQVAWKAGTGEACADASTVRVVAVDEDGNASEPFDYDYKP